MLGRHLSIAGGLHNALLFSEQYCVDAVQPFARNFRSERVSLWGAASWTSGSDGRWVTSRSATLLATAICAYMTLHLVYSGYRHLKPGGKLYHPRSVFVFYLVLIAGSIIFMFIATTMLLRGLIRGA